jgi:ATP-dependent protease ClpP protease subunit
MIHHVSLWAFGKIQEVEARSAQGRILNDKVYKMMAENCDQGENYFLDLVQKEKANADWYLTAEEAKKHNLACKLRVPKMRTTVKVEMSLD